MCSHPLYVHAAACTPWEALTNECTPRTGLTILSTSQVVAATTGFMLLFTGFVNDFVEAVNTEGSAIPIIEPSQVTAAPPVVRTDVEVRVLVPDASVSSVTAMEAELTAELV